MLIKSADGRQIAAASLLIAPYKLRVRLEGVRCSVPTEIRIERTGCRFGGTRPRFRCRLEAKLTGKDHLAERRRCRSSRSSTRLMHTWDGV